MLRKVAILAALLLAPTVASAYTVTPSSVSGTDWYGNTFTYYDTGAEVVRLTDLTEASSAVSLILEDAGQANTNRFGIYGFSTASDGTISLGATLEVFPGASSPGSNTDGTTLEWKFDQLLRQWSVTNKATHLAANIGTTFGFYIDSGDNRYYSQSTLNPESADLFKLYDLTDHNIPNSLDVLVGIEDLLGGDGDYNDMVVGLNDVAPVPEPSSMVLLGAGLLGLAIYGKRRRNV